MINYKLYTKFIASSLHIRRKGFWSTFAHSNCHISRKHHPQKDLYEVMILKNEFLTNGENSRRQNQKNQQKRLEKLAML